VLDINNANRKISISGTPTEAGVFEFSVAATNNDSTFVKTGRMTITDPNAPASSSGDNSEKIATTTGIASPVQRAPESATRFYRIFDMQGRPLYYGDRMPAHMPAVRVIVVEYSQKGTVTRRYVQ
jgi:hypothetical protein